MIPIPDSMSNSVRTLPRSLAQTLACGALAFLSSSLLSAKEPATPPDSVRPIFEIVEARGAIEIDGVLGDPGWDGALSFPLNYETRPAENQPPPVETECRITYDEQNLYVSFRAWDPRPEEIRSHLSDRDTAFRDDFVGIVLDTFNDGRRGFEFFVNPHGVQMDLFQDDVSQSETDAWDAIWKSAAQIDSDGYTVEIAIPFHQLRFQRTEEAQTWGFDALRFYPRGQRHRISVHPQERGRNCTLCQASKMRGFAGIDPGNNLEIVPTLTGSRTDSRDDLPNGPIAEGSEESDLGITARWGITPNIALNATINPDFSQVEADVAQLDVNNRFALFFPERRPFFLEGADLFDTDIDAVFTRNIADPSWGLKMSGKIGSNAVGVFVAEDEQTNLLFPGSQGSDADSFDFGSEAAVARFRRDLGESSNIGALVTARQADDYSNAVAGIDGLFRRDEHSFRYQFLHSATEYPTAIAEDFEQPLDRFSGAAYRVGYEYDSKNLFGYTRYEEIEGDFRADLGFVPQVGTTFLLAGAQRVWWGEEEDWYNRISFGGDWDRRTDEDGNVLEEESELFFNASGPLQSELFLGVGMRDRFFEGSVFENQTYANLFLRAAPTGDFSFRLNVNVGEGVDFDNVREGDQFRVSPRISYNWGTHLRATLSHDYRYLDVEEGRVFEASLSRVRLVYQFNVRTFVRAIVEYRQIDRDPALYIDEVVAEEENLFSQFLFSYKINPQTVLFAGYSDRQVGEDSFDLTQENRSFFLKLGYAWNL